MRLVYFDGQFVFQFNTKEPVTLEFSNDGENWEKVREDVTALIPSALKPGTIIKATAEGQRPEAIQIVKADEISNCLIPMPENGNLGTTTVSKSAVWREYPLEKEGEDENPGA